MRNARRLSHTPGLASSAFAHHYSRNHNCFLFLRVLRCFTSPRSHQPPYTFRRRRHPITSAGLPHSETPGSKSGCRLPEAYRRLPRPSSAPDAKASTVCPKKLHTHKHNTNNDRNQNPQPQRLQIPAQRCSRPLCSSQTTTSTHPKPPTKRDQQQAQPPEETNPHPPDTATPHPSGVTPPHHAGAGCRFPQNPNSVPGHPRTPTRPSHSNPPQGRAGGTNQAGTQDRPNNQCSTPSEPPTTPTPPQGQTTTMGSKCSLERR
jgi:hypothetical protein